MTILVVFVALCRVLLVFFTSYCIYLRAGVTLKVTLRAMHTMSSSCQVFARQKPLAKKENPKREESEVESVQ